MSGTPSGSLATLRPDLAGAFMEFDLEMNAKGYIGLQVFPVVEVGLQADNPGRIKLEEILFDGDTLRASRANYNEGDFEFENWQYATSEHGWKERVSARDRKRYKELIEPELIATARAMGVVMRNLEKRIAAKVFDTTAFTTDNGRRTDVSVRWSDYASADPNPIEDVKQARQAVWDRTGVYPNTLVVNMENFLNLQQNERVIDRVSASGAGDRVRATDITAEQLARVFSVEKVLVPNSARNAAGKGQPRQIEQIWSRDFASVCQTAETSDHQEACVGRTFHWGEDGSDIGGTVEEYWDEDTRCDVYRVRCETDEVVMYQEMNHLLGNVSAPAT